MAYRVANTSCTIGSSAAQWDTFSATPAMSTSSVALTTSNQVGTTFTSPGVTNNCTGALVYIATATTGGNMDVSLLANGVSIYTQTVPLTTGVTGFYWVHFTTPQTLAVITAGWYNLEAKITTGQPTNVRLSTDGASKVWFFPTDDVRGALTASDDLFVVGQNGTTTPITVTYSGTSNTVGSGLISLLTNSVNTQVLQIGWAVAIENGGTLQSDNTTNSTLTVKGIVRVNNGGQWVRNMASSAFTDILNFDPSTLALGNWGWFQFASGIINWSGAAKTFQGTTYVSGAGTVASPLIVTDAVSWAVGDRIAIAGTNGQGQTEDRYIITQNSSTSYVVSTTPGGAAAALTNTHLAGAAIANILYNIQVNGISNTQYPTGFSTETSASGYTNTFMNWVTFNFNGQTVILGNTPTALVDYNINHISWVSSANVLSFQASVQSRTMTGIIAYNFLATNNAGLINIGTSNRTFANCYFFLSQRVMINSETTAAGNTYSNCWFVDGNTANVNSSASLVLSSNVNTFNSCHFENTRQGAIFFSGGVGNIFNNCDFGSLGKNGLNGGYDLMQQAASLNTAVFNNCTFNSTTGIMNPTGTNGYTGGIIGTLYAFQTINSTTNNNFWYTNNGEARATGAGLTDTNTRTSGELSLRLYSQTALGQTYTFTILATPNQPVFAQLYAQLNAAFTGDGAASARMDLYLPGSTSVASTVTFSKADNTWKPYSVLANYSGTVPALATVVVTAITTTSVAYCYLADIFGGTNSFINFGVWNNGQPSPVMFQQLGDPTAVWNVLLSAIGTSGTTGAQIVNELTVGKFLALK